MDLQTLHDRTVAEFVTRVETVGDDRWDAPTPCAEWTVRELVNHVVGEDRWTPPLVAGRTIAEVGDALDGDLLGDEPVAAARGAAEDAVAAVAGAAPDATVHLSYGDESLGEYVHQLAADHLVHAWDLAVASGGDTRLDGELVAAIAAWFAEREGPYRAAGVIGPRVGSGGGDAQADLLGAFGRNPDWRPSA